jgi:hypothetical protein
MAGFAIKRYRKDRRKRPRALRASGLKKKIGKCFNYGKEEYFAKEYRGLKVNTIKPKESRKRPAAKANTAESDKYKLLSWIGCYDDECLTHLLKKDGAR